jgi:hypothetical protein
VRGNSCLQEVAYTYMFKMDCQDADTQALNGSKRQGENLKMWLQRGRNPPSQEFIISIHTLKVKLICTSLLLMGYN